MIHQENRGLSVVRNKGISVAKGEYIGFVDGDDFIELRCFICNMSAWPARVPENLEFRYYMDLSEIYEAGGSAENLSVTTNYMQGGTPSVIICHDEENHIYYYLTASFGVDTYEAYLKWCAKAKKILGSKETGSV